LTAFARAADKFAELGIKVVAFSVDEETTAKLVAKNRQAFPNGTPDELAAYIGR
jgi:alkyl hydroperoxide reductase subunit AhpC